MSSKNFYGLTGDVTVDGGILNVGNAQLYANTETSNVGIGTSNPEFELDVHGNANVGVLYSTFLHGDGSNIQNIVSSQWEGSPGDPIYYASNVGIANTSPVTATLQIGSNVVVDDVGSNVIHVTGNIYADYLVGDGSQLTGIAASLDQIVDQGNTVSNTIQIVSGQDTTSNVGLVTYEGVGISVSNTNPTGEFQFGVGSNLLVNVYSSNVLTVDGNVFAQKMTLGTVTVTPAYNLEQITATGATSNQTLVLSNVTTGLTADANIVVDGNVTAGSVITSGNVNAGNVITSTNINVGGDLSVTGNVYVDDMRVAEVASNLVTYDSTTGELLDSGGLFSNKLAVVSEQPPIALTGASTAVTSHGTYTIEASSGTVTELFDKNVSTVWTTSVSYNTLDGSYNTGSSSLAGVSGEWAKITMPYKTILRHVKIESTNSSIKDVTLVGLNADGLTWTSLKTVDGLNEETSTIIVNAATHHRTYGLIVRATNVGSTQAEIGDLKLFTESFSIDGGKVAMASSAVMGGETTVDQSGPHSRLPKAMPLKKFPEIVFESGKFDGSRTSTDATYDEQYYLQAGTTVKVVSETTSRVAHQAFNGDIVGANGNGWHTQFGFDRNTGLYDTSNNRGDTFTDTNGDPHLGMWIQTKFPNKIKVKNINLYIGNNLYRYPKSLVVLGHSSLSSLTGWTLLHTETDISTTTPALGDTTPTVLNVNADTAFDCYTILVKSARPEGVAGQQSIWVSEIEYYGYEELATQGDTSVDTTFTSIMNTPQTTGANVYIDGNLGETFTNRVTGPDATGPSATYDSTGKYWELNGELTSNVTVEANTFLQGDAPHSVSVWFNSSNLEANVSNTCVFSVSDQEKLDSVNLDLQSNTWHNLTYAYQGEGGSRVTYLDGRKVAEDQAEDTFGEYPPFAMTGYSQGGYVVSASGELSGTDNSHNIFDKDISDSSLWTPSGSGYDASTGAANSTGSITLTDGVQGHWVQLDLPHKLKLNYVGVAASSIGTRYAKDATIFGSNDGVSWTSVGGWTDNTHASNTLKYFSMNGVSGYYNKYRMVVTKNGPDTALTLTELKLYGHRENDLVRLPDPTNVLKYPHIAMTGPAQRGYVASASNEESSVRRVENLFRDDGQTTSWRSSSSTGYNSSGVYTGSANLGSDSGGTAFDVADKGEWIKIELPHKLQLSSFTLQVRNSPSNAGGSLSFGRAEFIKDGKIWGSDNGTSWSLVHTITGTSASSDTVINSYTVNSSIAYKYFALVIISTNSDSASAVGTSLSEWELFGTGVDSVPIQIGGGNIDKVANFRVYDKFVGEDQALEIWDAQKDEFGRAKSSMTLQKGRLGIGTTEPEGRLAVVDEPHNLEEFPPRAMTGYKTYFEGHGEFCVSSGDPDPSDAWSSNAGLGSLFDKGNTQANTHYYRTSAGSFDSGAPGYYAGSNSIGGISGAWIRIDFPYRAKLQSMNILTRSDAYNGRAPRDGYLLGKNSDEDEWTIIHEWTGALYYQFIERKFTIEASKYYSSYALVATRLLSAAETDLQSTNLSRMNISEWRLFGTREQGQSVLHDGQLTLTKSLNVPRIGPALDADDTPRRDRLVVEYNTSTNPTFEGAVRDTSGRGFHGALFGGAYYDANEKALRFDGSGDYTEVQLPSHQVKGEWIHSVSCWVKADIIDGEEAVWNIGDRTGQASSVVGSASTLAFNNTSPTLRWYFYNADAHTSNFTVATGQWYHITCVYTGGVSSATSQTIYVNGVEYAFNIFAGTGGALNFDANRDRILMLGRLPWGTASDLDGSISNFKLWDTALTAEEVKTLYDMGRCDEGHHVVNFSKTRVGIGLGDGEAPRGVLDVRGDLYLSGNIIRNTSSAKSGGVWFPTYGFEVPGSTFVEDQRHGQYHIINNQLTAVYKARVVSNSGAGTIRISIPGGIEPAGHVTANTIVIGWWARNGDLGATNVGPYLITNIGNGYGQLWHPGQTNNQVRLDGSSLEADQYWTIFLSYPVE